MQDFVLRLFTYSSLPCKPSACATAHNWTIPGQYTVLRGKSTDAGDTTICFQTKFQSK